MVKEVYADEAEWRFPKTDERTVIIGRTGSGKTFMEMFLLSEANFDETPWIIFDFKGDSFIQELINRGYAKLIPLGELPTEPGLYVVRPLPGDDEEVETYFWEIWKRGNIGVAIDEIYMIDPYSESWRAILTQGRSKNIPGIMLTQRPKRISPFNFSEASHIVLFDINWQKDRDTAGEHMPIDKDVRLAEYHSRWYDVNRNRLFHVHPAPEREAILARFAARLPPEAEPEKPARIIV